MNRRSSQRNNRRPQPGALRWGLCCQFAEHPIRFRSTTVTAMLRYAPAERHRRLAELCRENADALWKALEYCAGHGIGCFRINSQILPVKTHSEAGYRIEDLPGAGQIVTAFERCGQFALRHDLRLCFHPDQFVVLNSPREDVVARSLAELEYHAEIAHWLGADVINIHAGGAYGDKPAALTRLARNLARLSSGARSRLTLENDDTTYTPEELLPLCRSEGLPLVYDVHHHRCLPDALTIEEATAEARATWNREPLFHLSSPKHGWNGPHCREHHDYIVPTDFPAAWREMALTVEVEAKAKELAIQRLRVAIEGADQSTSRRLVPRAALRPNAPMRTPRSRCDA